LVAPAELPYGDLVRDLAGDEFEDELVDAQGEAETFDLDGIDVDLVTIQEADGWHVSLWYTVAEAARTSGDERPPVPDFGNSEIQPIGADSPDAAVEQLLMEALDLDLAGVIGMLPPDEMRVLYDYVPLFLDEAEEAAQEARDDGFDAEVRELGVRADGSGSTRRVVVESFDITAGIEGEDSVRATWDGACVAMEITYDDEWDSWDGDRLTDRFEGCNDGTVEVNGESIFEDEEELFDEVITPMQDMFGGDGSAMLAFTVVESGGKWYVSPTRSLFEPMLVALRGIDSDELRDFVEGFLDELESPDGLFGEVGGGECFVPVEELDDFDANCDFDDGAFEEEGDVEPVPAPGDECYELYDELDLDASDEEWEAADEALDQCLADTGIDTSSPGEECDALWDGLDDDATAEELDAMQAEVAACYDDAGVPVFDPDSPLAGTDDVLISCMTELDEAGELGDEPSPEAMDLLIDCVAAEDADHEALPCLEELAVATADPAFDPDDEDSIACLLDAVDPDLMDIDDDATATTMTAPPPTTTP
jgi:hypothetical protein